MCNLLLSSGADHIDALAENIKKLNYQLLKVNFCFFTLFGIRLLWVLLGRQMIFYFRCISYSW